MPEPTKSKKPAKRSKKSLEARLAAVEYSVAHHYHTTDHQVVLKAHAKHPKPSVDADAAAPPAQT